MSFRPMRRNARALTAAEAEAILAAGQYGVLSVTGDDGYPYGVPVNYGYADGKLYIHCAAVGHKLDALRRNPKVCFTVVSDHRLLPEAYTARFESVVVFGKAAVLEAEGEKHRAMDAMISVLAPQVRTNALTDCGSNGYVMLEITPNHITGKSNRRDVETE